MAVGGVASVGRDRERVFLSTVIAEREEANVLHTQDGITILFRGLINASRSSLNGVPSQICQHFLVGFPHDWKKYSPHSFGDQDIDGVTASAHSSASSNRMDSIFSNNCLLPNKICNGLGVSFENDSDNTECSTVMNTVECESNNSTSLNSSHLQVDMFNGGKGISLESQAGKPTTAQSFMATYDSNVCSGKSMVKPPTSTKQMTRDQFSGDHKEKQHIRQKIVFDASNSCNRRVTRSMSKRSHNT